MLSLLWLIPALPLAGFLLLALSGRRIAPGATAVIGVGSVGLSAVVAGLVAFDFMTSPPAGARYTQTLWTWMTVGRLTPKIAFELDALSLLMVLVVTVVAVLIHLYSTRYMAGEDGYSRFFAYMNLFVAMMLVLVLADNLLLLYLGWEGVGLCSYLLIGFWYKDPANLRAATKAFVVTRIGDVGLAIGLFLLYTQLGTLDIQTVMSRALVAWEPGSTLAVAAAFLLFVGAIGKSAQVPLHTWLPDAMAGPTPTSALIHAATMVTAGVYLIARTHVLFSLAPSVETLVAVMGAITLLLAAFSALAQTDLKRVLAYSTMSQVGYMFMALGVGAWSAALFHFMTHAFFKALLFLAAGVVILSMQHEQNMLKMGGLRTRLPVTFWTFAIGALSLAAVPLISSGFYSKELILYEDFASPLGSVWLWTAGVVGAVITALYTARMVLFTFFGTGRGHAAPLKSAALHVPLIILAILSTVAGFVELPHPFTFRPFSEFLNTAFHATAIVPEKPLTAGAVLLVQILPPLLVLGAIWVAYEWYGKNPHAVRQAGKPDLLHRWWRAGWGFDWLYNGLVVQPVLWAARMNKADMIENFSRAITALTRGAYRTLSATQNGRLRWYAGGLALGAAIVIALVLWR